MSIHLNWGKAVALFRLYLGRTSFRVSVLAPLLWLLICIWSPSFAADAPNRISVAYWINGAPFAFTNANGKPDGRVIDTWKLWSKKTGIEVEFVGLSWNETLKRVRDGSIDVHGHLFFTAERDTYFDYGAAYLRIDTHIFLHESIDFPETLEELKAFRIAVLAGDATKEWLDHRFGPGVGVEVPDFPALIESLKRRQLKAFAVDTPPALHQLAKSGLLPSFHYQRHKPLFTNDIFFAIKKGRQALLKTVQAGMDAITDREHLLVARTWASGQRAENPSGLVIAIDGEYPPLTSVGIDGNPQGMLVDLWREWGRTVGSSVRFRVGKWSETLDTVRGREADIHSGLSKTDDRAEWMAFSSPIQKIKTALFDRKDATVTSLDSLSGKRVGAVAGTYQAQYLEKNFPAIEVVESKGTTDNVIALLRGEIDAFVEEVPAALALIAKLGVSGTIDQGPELYSTEIHAGVNKDNTSLLKQINEGLARIPRHRLAEIEARWFSDPQDRFFRVDQNTVNLTEEEHAWIETHPTVKVGGELDWAPFDFVGKDGEYQGLSKDVLDLIAKKTGLKFTYVTGQTWAELLKSFERGELAILPAIYHSQERAAFTTYTEPYFEVRDYVFMRDDAEPLRKTDDLAHKTVAVIDGYVIEDRLKNQVPEIDFQKVRSLQDGIDAILLGRADAYVDGYAIVSYHLAKTMQTGLKPVLPIKEFKSLLHIGISKHEPVLAGIVKKGLAAITSEEHRAIRQTWFAQAPQASDSRMVSPETARKTDGSIDPKVVARRLILSDKEKAWLAEAPAVRARVGTFPPFQFWDQDTGHGISVDYFKLFCEGLELKCEFVTGIPWSETIKNVSEGKDADVILHVNRLPEREKVLAFTHDYTEIPRVIFTRNDSPFVGHVDDLIGKEISIEKGYSIQKMLAKDYPQISQRRVGTTREALELVSLGTVDAYIGALVTASHIMQKEGYTNLKVAAPTHYGPDKAAMGVRKDWPLLSGLLDRYLKALTPDEKSFIKGRWLSIRYEHGIRFLDVVLWIGGIILIAGTIVAVIVYWNRRLGREIEERKRAQAREAEAHQEIVEAHAIISSSIKYASRIQRAVLPSETLFQSTLVQNSFFLRSPSV